MSRIVADGQLASTSSTLLGADRYERLVSVWLFNTSLGLTQTVRLILSSRVVAYADLKPLEAIYVGGIGMDRTSVLAGYSTYADTVDYLISQTHDRSWLRGIALSEKFQVEARGKTGTMKANRAITVTIPGRTVHRKVIVREGGLLEVA